MPLVNGSSEKNISQNIATERAAGKPEAQAVAIAEQKARDADPAAYTEFMSVAEIAKRNKEYWEGANGDLP